MSRFSIGARLLAGLCLLVGAAGCRQKAVDAGNAGDAADTAPVTVELTTAIVRPVETTLTAQGTLSPGQGSSAKIAATIPGRLAAVNVREGEHVSRNQVIAVIDNRPQRAAVNSASNDTATSRIAVSTENGFMTTSKMQEPASN